MNISMLKSPDVQCNEFVRQKPDATLEYMPAWSCMIEQTFGHKSCYLVAREGDSICGVLPLTHVRSKLFGNRMISQAFSNYGGPVVESLGASDALYKRAVELATELNCDWMEIRNVDPLPYDLREATNKITMHLQLTPEPNELWHSFKPKVRNQVRKAEKSGIVVLSGGLELLDDFYRVWTVRMHQLGTPCYSRKLFSAIMKTFPENCRIFLVHLNNTTVGGAFVYCFNGLVQIRWAATLVEYNTLCPNNLLYWSIMKHYCLAGASCFDFGRTTVNSGQHRFKKQWGAIEIPLHYQYWTRPGHKLSLAKPDNPKYKKKVELWKKLPLWMTRLAGPYISRSLP